MRRTTTAIGLISTLLLSCGASVLRPPSVAPPLIAGMPSYEGELVVQPEATEGPSLEMRFPYANERSTLGWGAFHLWARPHHDHVGVTALIDAPSENMRWESCEDIDLRIDNRVETLPVRYVGRPMDGSLGHYDAIQVQLTVLTLRKIGNARRVTGVACGDAFEITDDQRDTFRRFVEWFDALAAVGQLRDAPWYREVGPRVTLLPLEDDGEEFIEG